MIEAQSQQGVVLAIFSVVSLGCIYALCLCCGKKYRMQQDNDLYDQDDFDQDTEYAESTKHTTGLRPIQTKMPSTSRQSTTNRPVNSDIQWSYQNLAVVENGILEPTYVDPIPDELYANEDTTGTYENVFPTPAVRHDSDSCNYENWDNRYEDDEPDYVNDIRQ